MDFSFDDWKKAVDEAISSGGTVRKEIVQRADMKARYENTNGELSFKSEVARNGMTDWQAYDSVCASYPCIGEKVDETMMPPHLLRTMSLIALEKALWHKDPGGTYGGQQLVRSPSTRYWERALDLLPEDGREGSFFFPAKVSNPASPAKRSVFANFDETDPRPQTTGAPSPRLITRAYEHVTDKRNLADSVIWLTARKKPRRPAPMALVSYAREGLGPCRFPVPPDAGSIENSERFRPVPPGNAEKYGRTWPEGVPEVGHLASGNGAPEVVHMNEAVPVKDVFVLNLGETSRV